MIDRNKAFKEAHSAEAEAGLARLKQVAREGGNLFEVMMDIVEHCTGSFGIIEPDRHGYRRR